MLPTLLDMDILSEILERSATTTYCELAAPI